MGDGGKHSVGLVWVRGAVRQTRLLLASEQIFGKGSST